MLRIKKYNLVKYKLKTNMKTNKVVNSDKVYGLFYKDHGNWRVAANGNRYTLASARLVKDRVKKSTKSQVIVRKVNFS